MHKRQFLKMSALAGMGSISGFAALGKIMAGAAHLSPHETARDDDFWQSLRGDYALKTEYINLENGYYCIQPKPILDKYLEHIRYVNLEGAHYMRTVQEANKKAAAAGLAALAGCSADEVIITRNATESLDLVISGFKWREGDEAIMAEQDYGSMLEMFRQVAKRYGIANKVLSVPMDPASDHEIVTMYENAITPKTRLLMVCHMINITGHILPVQKICDMAHRKGVQVMVDGAHSFAHIQFNVPDLHCDYFGTSLHKWLSVPLGAGMLYANKEHIADLWPIFAEGGDKKPGDIARLNHTGTTPVATDLTIADAIDFYHTIGAARKEARLRYLQNYWVSKVRGLPRVVINTPTDPLRSCAIANVGIEGIKPGDWADILLKKYNIYTVAIDSAGVHGCRITPNLFTTTAELDQLVHAIKSEAA